MADELDLLGTTNPEFANARDVARSASQLVGILIIQQWYNAITSQKQYYNTRKQSSMVEHNLRAYLSQVRSVYTMIKPLLEKTDLPVVELMQYENFNGLTDEELEIALDNITGFLTKDLKLLKVDTQKQYPLERPVLRNKLMIG